MDKELFISLVEDASMALRQLNDMMEDNAGLMPPSMSYDEESEVQNLFTLMEELQEHYCE